MNLRVACLPLLCLLAACPKKTAPPVDGVKNTSTTPAATPPAGSTGVCRDLAAEAGSEASEIANCPDIDELARGDGLGASDDLPPVAPSVLPEWDLDQLRDFACAYACASAGAKAHLLAWYVMEDRRPLRNHNAAFVVEHTAAAKWTVVVMYRHATNDWWNIDINFHSPDQPVVELDHRPTPAEVYSILDDNGWMFGPDDDWDVPAGNVIEQLWPVATGGPADRFYPDATER